MTKEERNRRLLEQYNEALTLQIEARTQAIELKEQFELLVQFIRDEHDAGLPLPVSVRKIIDASTPASRLLHTPIDFEPTEYMHPDTGALSEPDWHKAGEEYRRDQGEV